MVIFFWLKNLKRLALVSALFFVVSTSVAFAHAYEYGYSLYSFTYNATSGSTYYDQAASNWRNAVGTSKYNDHSPVS